MTELKPKINNNLYETLVKITQSDGTVRYAINYALNLQGTLVQIGEWPDGKEEKQAVIQKLCAVTTLTAEQAFELWEKRQIF